jgi:hypothetical protein
MGEECMQGRDMFAWLQSIVNRFTQNCTRELGFNHGSPSQQYHFFRTRLTRYRRRYPTNNALLTLVSEKPTSQCYTCANYAVGAEPPPRRATETKGTA